jgi:hypothetical protein
LDVSLDNQWSGMKAKQLDEGFDSIENKLGKVLEMQ